MRFSKLIKKSLDSSVSVILNIFQNLILFSHFEILKQVQDDTQKMLLKKYQDDAVRELISATLHNLMKEWERTLVLKAPTWSGKTVMMQEYLRRLVEMPHSREFVFLWISVNDLSRQSKRSFERNLAWSSLHFSELSDIVDRELKKNEILFINWESINKIDGVTGEWKVLAMKDNERDENLPTYLANTHEAGREIILIVDESHKNLDSARAQDLIKNYIKPKIQIEVSATPDSQWVAQTIDVDISQVIESGMIKKEILINPFINVDIVGAWTDRILIEQALKKREELIEAYRSEETTISPLILIQLPSDSSWRKSTKTLSILDVTKIENTKNVLAQCGITLENKKLAIWLSEDKTNKDLIDEDNSPIEVLIFKQAIATGWDCPRAQILVMFREMQSIVFQIQTIGRILRMPEQKHYKDHILNTAYVYTDFEKWNIWIYESAQNIIKNRLWSRKEVYTTISLSSKYLKRVEYNDLGKSFYTNLHDTLFSYFNGNITDRFLENIERLESIWLKVRKEDINITDTIITNGRMFVDIDEHTGEKIFSETSLDTKREQDLVKIAFDSYARERVWPQFTNIARSYKTVIEALYRVLEKYILGPTYSRYDIQRFILSNEKIITEILERAKEKYLPLRRAEVESKRKNEISKRTWEVPTITTFPENSVEVKYKKSIIEPFYTGTLTKGEKLFIEEYLEKNESVKWWYRNGVKSEQFFSIPYQDSNGETQNFFPDFIVQYEDGIVGIFDPKDGFTLEIDRPKHIALTEYLQRENCIRLIWWFVRNQGAENIAFYKTVSDNYWVDNMQGWGRL